MRQRVEERRGGEQQLSPLLELATRDRRRVRVPPATNAVAQRRLNGGFAALTRRLRVAATRHVAATLGSAATRGAAVARSLLCHPEGHHGDAVRERVRLLVGSERRQIEHSHLWRGRYMAVTRPLHERYMAVMVGSHQVGLGLLEDPVR